MDEEIIKDNVIDSSDAVMMVKNFPTEILHSYDLAKLSLIL